jgi:Flp pilus assembly protein TadG
MPKILSQLWRPLSRRSAPKTRGQSLVEFALTLPIFLFVLLVGLQFAIIGMTYFSEMRVTRDAARYAAIHPDTTDANIVAYAQSRPLTLIPSRITTTSMTVEPPCGTLDGSGKCANRQSAANLSVQLAYNMSNLIFLPTTYGFGSNQITIPIGIPAYKVTVMIE